MLLKKLTKLLLCMSIISSSYAQDSKLYDNLIKDAINKYREGKYEESLTDFQLAFEIKKDNTIDLYNAACSSALANNLDLAFGFLRICLDKGYSDADHLEKDPDLYNLHPLPEWKKVVIMVRENKKNSVTPAGLIYKIENLIDSNNTEEIIQLSHHMSDSDEIKNISENLESIYQILKKWDIQKLKSRSTGYSNSMSSSLSENKFSHFYENTYKIAPLFVEARKQLFTYPQPQLFTYPLGFKIEIILKEQGNQWRLDEINLVNQRLSEGYNLLEDIDSFFAQPDSVYFKFGISNAEKFISGTGTIKIPGIDFLNKDIQLDYIQDISYSNSNTLESNYLSLLLVKKGNEAHEVFNRVLKKSKPEIYILEFIFKMDSMNECLISNGNGFGFYKLNNLEKIRDLIVKELCVSD